MRVIVGACIAMLLTSPASADSFGAEVMLRAKVWRACVVASSEKVAVKSKQTADDIVGVYIDECGYPEMIEFIKAYSKTKPDYDESISTRAAHMLLRGERMSIAAEARQAVVKSRVKAGL